MNTRTAELLILADGFTIEDAKTLTIDEANALLRKLLLAGILIDAAMIVRDESLDWQDKQVRRLRGAATDQTP